MEGEKLDHEYRGRFGFNNKDFVIVFLNAAAENNMVNLDSLSTGV